MRYFLGVDGGGSTLRVIIIDAAVNTISLIAQPATSNPSIVGADVAADLIRAGVRAAIAQSGLAAEQIAAAGLGIAGGDVRHSEVWLRSLLPTVLPAALIVPSSDQEIALVGANGERFGVLLLAGTGSVAYGVNRAGQGAHVGGWGYLIGDEGSGYWLATQALGAIVRAADGRGTSTKLTDTLLGELNLSRPADLVHWLYHGNDSRNQRVAALAPLVLSVATDGDEVAIAIVADGAAHLTAHYHAIVKRLDMDTPKIAFAGGLLQAPTLLRAELLHRLEVTDAPQPLYPPVIGAALLAKITYDRGTQST